MEMDKKTRIAAAALLFAGLGIVSTGCSHGNQPQSASGSQTSSAPMKMLPNGSAPPADSPALEAAKKRFAAGQ